MGLLFWRRGKAPCAKTGWSSDAADLFYARRHTVLPAGSLSAVAGFAGRHPVLLAVLGFLVPQAPTAEASEEVSRIMWEGDCSSAERGVAQRLIGRHGYACRMVDFCTPLGTYEYSVACNGYRYSYKIKDRGGKWMVEVEDPPKRW